MMSMEERESSYKRGEQEGLLLGYHKEMYKDAFEKPTLRERCCAVYCARNSKTSWAFAVSAIFIIIGTLATLYGYFIPSMYMSLTTGVNSNLTTTIRDKSRLERETESMMKMYRERDVFVLVGLSVLFLGGLILSLALLVPLCVAEWAMERLPSPSRIIVMNELQRGNGKREENCIDRAKEDDF